MKTTKTKQKHIWQIDDDVYFVEESSMRGMFPHIGKGTVHEIHRNTLRVKTGNGEYDYVTIDITKCYNDYEQLFYDLSLDLIKQQERFNAAKAGKHAH